MKLYRSYRSVLFCLLAFGTFSSTMAAEHWVKLGSVRASMSAEKATFLLDDSLPVNRVRFYVTNGDVTLVKTKLHFAKKQVIMESFQRTVRAGEFSRTIPLVNPKQQTLKKVEIFYRVVKQTKPTSEAQISLMVVPAPKY